MDSMESMFKKQAVGKIANSVPGTHPKLQFFITIIFVEQVIIGTIQNNATCSRQCADID